MPVAAIPVDPRLAYNYRIEINGLEIALVEKINIPKEASASVDHAHGGQINTTKTAGKVSFEDMVLEKIMPSEGSDKFFSNWRTRVKTQGAADYKEQIDIFHLGPDDTGSRIDHWQLDGCWPKELDYGDQDGNAESDKVIETVTISVDNVTRI